MDAQLVFAAGAKVFQDVFGHAPQEREAQGPAFLPVEQEQLFHFWRPRCSS
jgi:hypothetical protein